MPVPCTTKDDSKIIMIVHPICCGLDVDKESVSACVIFPDRKGEEQYEVKVFGTFTDDLTRLREWLVELSTRKKKGGHLTPRKAPKTEKFTRQS